MRTRSGRSSRADGDRILAGLDLADHLEAVGELDDRPRDVAKRRLVVDDQTLEHSLHCLERYPRLRREVASVLAPHLRVMQAP